MIRLSSQAITRSNRHRSVMVMSSIASTARASAMLFDIGER